MVEVLKKITTRNILAISVVGVFLYLTMFIVTQASELITAATTDPATAAALGVGTVLIGTLVAKVSDIIQFFFRKKPANETS